MPQRPHHPHRPYDALMALLPREAAQVPDIPAIDCTRAQALAASFGVDCARFDAALLGLYLSRMPRVRPVAPAAPQAWPMGLAA